MTKNKNKRVGMGMKPRTSAIDEVRRGVVVSAIAGHEENEKEAVLEQPEPVETGGSLEENSVQNLDSEEIPDVAADKPSEDSRTRIDDLLMRSMTDELSPENVEKPIEAVFGEIGPGQNAETGCISNEELQKRKDANPLLIVDRNSGAIGIFTPGADHDDHIDAAMLGAIGIANIGQRPDGTYGLVVTIPEGLIEPIRQQAESDRVTPEEWVSTRLVEYMDSWWQPAASR